MNGKTIENDLEYHSGMRSVCVCSAILSVGRFSLLRLRESQWTTAATKTVISVERRADRVVGDPLQPSSEQQKVLAPQSSENK